VAPVVLPSSQALGQGAVVMPQSFGMVAPAMQPSSFGVVAPRVLPSSQALGQGAAVLPSSPGVVAPVVLPSSQALGQGAVALPSSPGVVAPQLAVTRSSPAVAEEQAGTPGTAAQRGTLAQAAADQVASPPTSS